MNVTFNTLTKTMNLSRDGDSLSSPLLSASLSAYWMLAYRFSYVTAFCSSLEVSWNEFDAFTTLMPSQYNRTTTRPQHVAGLMKIMMMENAYDAIQKTK